MSTEYNSPASHESALKILAQEMKASTEEVVQIYKNELASLEVGARIRTFIPALALRRARATLHKRQHPDVAR